MPFQRWLEKNGKKKVDLKILQWYECRYEADGQ